MRYAAWTALFLVSSSCSGGGGGSDAGAGIDSATTIDAADDLVDAAPPAADAIAPADAAPVDAAAADAATSDGGGSFGCNPIAQTGCTSGEKCTFIVDSLAPLLGHTGCAPAGTVAEGGPCLSASSSETGVDDCAAGLFCTSSVCTEICGTIGDINCDLSEGCVSFNGLFEDAENVGLCQPACDPVAASTGCPSGEGCYLNMSTANTTCAASCESNPACDAGNTKPVDYPGDCAGSNWGTQHCNCECLNCCEPGYGCLLNNDPVSATGLVCAYFCDTTSSGGPTCADSSVGGLSCRQVSTFYSNTGNVDPSIGMCVPGDLFPCFGCYDPAEPGCDAVTCP